MDVHERKRLQNKLSQRKHRQKQKQRIEELEKELAVLNNKVNLCIYKDQSKLQLLKIYQKTENKIQEIDSSVRELQEFLNGEIFRSIQSDVEKLKAGDIVLTDDEADGSRLHEVNAYDDDDDDAYDEEEELNPKSVIQTPSSITEFNKGNFMSFETNPIDFDLNDFGVFNFIQKYQENPIPRIDSNSVLKYYIYNEICIHPSNLLEIINGIGVQSISYINEIPEKSNIISSPHFLNMVCSYSNNLFEQIPKFKNFAFAFGGVKWLVGQVLFFGLTNPNIEPLIKPILFNKSNDFNEANYQILVDNITKYLEISWLKDKYSMNNNTSLLLLHSDTLFPKQPKESSDSFILHEWFYPTALQTYLLKHETYQEYPHWVNFLIWPEMRDILLLNIKKISTGMQDVFYNNLMDSVVLLLKNQPIYDNSKNVVGRRDKLFYFVDLTNLINLTVNDKNNNSTSKCQPTLEYLTENGLFNPGEWKLTRTYANKFGSLIPKKLVCWNIDDTKGENIVRPHYL